MSYLNGTYLDSTYLNGTELSEEDAAELSGYLPDNVRGLMGLPGFLQREVMIPGIGPVTVKTIIIVALIAAGAYYILQRREKAA